MYLTLLTSLLMAAVGRVSAGYDAGSHKNLAVYWGANSVGPNAPEESWQGPLVEYCKAPEVDIIIVAFVLDPTVPKLSFANQGNSVNCDMSPQSLSPTGEPTVCETLGKNITSCQDDYNKTVLLSIGGAQGSTFSFANEAAAYDNASKMWKMFGPSKNAGTEKRPFGDAFVNGFDLDIETTIPNMGAWAKAMRDLMEQDSPGNYYLSAAPQCPAGHLQDILSATTFDMVFVQYYNNQECSYIDSGNARGPDSYKKSVEAWNAWAANNTKGSSKWFMGLPGGKSAATTGYLEVADMTAAVGELSGKGHFGGVMLWDASQSWKGNDNYYQKVKEVLTG